MFHIAALASLFALLCISCRAQTAARQTASPYPGSYDSWRPTCPTARWDRAVIRMRERGMLPRRAAVGAHACESSATAYLRFWAEEVHRPCDVPAELIHKYLGVWSSAQYVLLTDYDDA